MLARQSSCQRTAILASVHCCCSAARCRAARFRNTKRSRRFMLRIWQCRRTCVFGALAVLAAPPLAGQPAGAPVRGRHVQGIQDQAAVAIPELGRRSGFVGCSQISRAEAAQRRQSLAVDARQRRQREPVCSAAAEIQGQACTRRVHPPPLRTPQPADQASCQAPPPRTALAPKASFAQPCTQAARSRCSNKIRSLPPRIACSAASANRR